MHRTALSDLRGWYQKSLRKPLVLRGARQVGKSTLVRLFSKEQGLELIEINLEKTKIKEIENEESFSLDRVIEEIEVVAGQKIGVRTLLFLDEIQAQPLSLNRLRYFFEERPDIVLIAAGSLLEVALERAKFSMPVGRVESYHLGPMTFYEFLQAKGEEIVLDQIKSLNSRKSPTEALHQRAMELLKEFYFVGGMPECVREFSADRDFKKIRELQISLLHTYQEDIPKYTMFKQGERVEEVFHYTPAHIGEKVQFSNISSAHSEKIREAIRLLSKAHVVYPVFHNSCSGFPLKSGADSRVFKLYFLDVGLYNAKMGLEWKDFLRLEPEELVTKGKIAEQFVAQHLFFREPTEMPELYYWLRGGRAHAAEVDFVVAKGPKIYPIEVKSGSEGKMRSLWQYVYEKKPELAMKFDLAIRSKPWCRACYGISTKDGIQQVECSLVAAPLYAIENWKEYLTDLKECP